MSTATPPTSTPRSPTTSPVSPSSTTKSGVWLHAGLIGRLAELLGRYQGEQLLPALLTAIHPHLTDDAVPPAKPPLYVEIPLVRQLSRLLGMDRTELLLSVLAEIGPYLQHPGYPPPPGQVGNDAALSTRELQVLTGMAHGRSNGTIGRALYLSEDTVKTHARRMFRKLGAVDRAHAVALGYQRGVLPLDAVQDVA